MAALCWARLLVAVVPFRWWRRTLGGIASSGSSGAAFEARRLAAHVDWAARLLPIQFKCLPRAMALSWMLRSRQIQHAMIFAVRPPEFRNAADQLHAWIERDGEILIGELAGPWMETLRLGK